MASAVVVLKHETTTLHQRHNYISIDFKLVVGDYVKEVTNPDKVGSGPISIFFLVLVLVFLFFLYSSTELQPIPANQFSHTIDQKTRSGVRKFLLG